MALAVKNLLADAEDLGDAGSIPGSGRSPGGGNGNPLQYSCLENPMDREGWWATDRGVAKSRTRLKWLSSSSSSIKEKNLKRIYIYVCVYIYIHTHIYDCMCAKSLQLCVILLRPCRLWPARLPCPWDSPSKNTGVGCHAVLQGIFPTQDRTTLPVLYH